MCRNDALNSFYITKKNAYFVVAYYAHECEGAWLRC